MSKTKFTDDTRFNIENLRSSADINTEEAQLIIDFLLEKSIIKPVYLYCCQNNNHCGRVIMSSYTRDNFSSDSKISCMVCEYEEDIFEWDINNITPKTSYEISLNLLQSLDGIYRDIESICRCKNSHENISKYIQDFLIEYRNKLKTLCLATRSFKNIEVAQNEVEKLNKVYNQFVSIDNENKVNLNTSVDSTGFNEGDLSNYMEKFGNKEPKPDGYVILERHLIRGKDGEDFLTDFGFRWKNKVYTTIESAEEALLHLTGGIDKGMLEIQPIYLKK